MQSGSYWAFREAAELPDYDRYEPDFTSLWDKSHVARKPHLCSVCGEEIAPGSRYRSIGFLMDGRFETQKVHGVVGFPSTCPRWAERDRRELADQFDRDAADFFPTETPQPAASSRGSELANSGRGESPRDDQNLPTPKEAL
jgi:hypothetical protein